MNIDNLLNAKKLIDTELNNNINSKDELQPIYQNKLAYITDGMRDLISRIENPDKHDKINKIQNMGNVYKRKPCSEETKRKIGLANSGKKQSEEIIEKRRIKLIGRKPSYETRVKISEKNTKDVPVDLIIKKYIEEEKSLDTISLELSLDAGLIRRRLIRKGIIMRKGMTDKCRKENGEKISKSLKKLWKEDKEYRESQLKKITNQVVPNKPEKNFMEFIKKYNLKFTYVGDGKFWLTGINFCFNPDFIDCENKVIIEIYGDYWHNRDDMKERDIERLETYSKYNYKTIIIWVSELENEELVLNRINSLYNNKEVM